MTDSAHERTRDKERDEETLLGDADEVKHPSIEEQVDEELQREKERDQSDA
jgi:hypothetical protein